MARILTKYRLLAAAGSVALLAGAASAGLTVSSELDSSDPTWDRYRFWLSGFTGADASYVYSPPPGTTLPQHAQNNQVNSIAGTFTVSPGGMMSVPGDIIYDDGGPQVVTWQDLTNAGYNPPPAAPPLTVPRSTGQYTNIVPLGFSRSPDTPTPASMTGTWFGIPGPVNSNFKTPLATYTNGPITLPNGLQSRGSALFEIYVSKGAVLQFAGNYNSYAVNNGTVSFGVLNTWDAEGANTNWNTAANWGDNNVPASGANVSFILAGNTATMNVPATVGTITFNRGAAFSIGGGSNLTINDGISVLDDQAYAITAPVVLGGANTWHVAVGNTLTVSGGVSGASTITKTGSGTAELGGNNPAFTGNLQVAAGTLRISGTSGNVGNVGGAGALVLLSGATMTANHYRTQVLDLQGTAVASVRANGGAAGVSKVETLTMSGGAKLNLGDNDLVIGTANLATVRAWIQSGYNGGLWNGNGIVGTPMGTDKALGYASGSDPVLQNLGNVFNGQTFDADSVIVKYTYAADANLDGQVDVVDLGILATNWQGTGKNWTTADFNYSPDGKVDVVDLGILATNWQKGVGSPLSLSFAEALRQFPEFGEVVVVPEPAAVGLLGLMAAMGLRRRRGR